MIFKNGPSTLENQYFNGLKMSVLNPLKENPIFSQKKILVKILKGYCIGVNKGCAILNFLKYWWKFELSKSN